MILVSETSLTIAVVAMIFVTFVVGAFYKKRDITSKEGHPLPPGPPAKWFWDSVMPTVNISSTLNRWANEYGPVITLRRGSEITIVIGRVSAATEIMEKEGNALADRPQMIAADELLSGGKRLTLVGSGDRFRRLRKAVHTHFQIKAVETYKDIQSEQARTLILDVLDDPKNFHQKHMHRFSTSIILRITYGNSKSVSVDDPEFINMKQIVQHFIEGMRLDAYLVDRFPWLKYVPGYGMRLKGYYKFDLKFYRGQLDRVKSAMEIGDAAPSFCKTLLENTHDHQLSFDEMCFLAGTLSEAGSDTSADAVITMIMAAACFPGTRLRVQEELDTVVGMDRLPSWSDWDDLPQLHAFISEALRWRPVTPLGFPHRSTRDIFWRGYYIPAGATVTGNQWAISRDPVVFPNPEKFDPQRWLDQNGELRNDIECYPFGFGRRVCPGMDLANRSMFIALAHLLWSFRIREHPGTPIDTTPDMDNAVAHLPPFEVDFVPRIDVERLREAMVM